MLMHRITIIKVHNVKQIFAQAHQLHTIHKSDDSL